ncbi:MAG: glycosyltransferase family 9 protein [Terracidiphilus sp.]
MQPDPTIRRVLIHRLGSLGDTVVALPCFHLIARVFSNAERRLLTNFPVHAKAPASAAVLGCSGLVHGYMRYAVGTRNPLELLRLAQEIRRFRPDLVVYLMHIRPWKAIRRDRMFYRLAGVRRIVGMAAEKEMKFRFDEDAGLFEREPFRLARLVGELGDAEPAKLANWDMMLSDGERETAREAVRMLGDSPLIVCGPGTKMPAKDWGPDNWQALLGRIDRKYPGHSLALVGANEEFNVAEHAAKQWMGPWVNLCGRLAPRGTAALLQHAKIFLGPDSGPMHLAASVGTPCVIPFSAASPPGIWFPYGNKHQIVYHRTRCAGCYLEKCNVDGHPCLTSISVEEMETAVDRVMNGQDGLRTLTVIA